MKKKFEWRRFVALLVAIIVAESVAANYSQVDTARWYGILWILIPGAVAFLVIYYVLMFVFQKITKSK